MEDKNLYYIEMMARLLGLNTLEAYQTQINASRASKNAWIWAAGVYHEMLEWQQKLEKSSKQFTIAGVDIKVLASTNFSITARVMSSYGISIANSDLVGLKELTFSVLDKKTPVALLADCNYIIGLIGPNATGLADYAIDDDYKANLVELAGSLETMTKLPLAVIKQHASDKKQYMALEKNARKFFKEQFDPFMDIYQILDVSFYLAYTAARKVRHHHLKRKIVPQTPTTGTLETMVVMKTTLVPAAGATLVIERVENTYITDADGETYTAGLAPGLYHARIVKTDCKDIVFDFSIVAGKTCALQFIMELANVGHEEPPVT